MPVIPYLGQIIVPMTRTAYSLPGLGLTESGYFSNQYAPDVSIQEIDKISAWWWDDVTITEANYLSMLFDPGSGPQAYANKTFRPGLTALKTFDFTALGNQLLLDGSESTIGTPWFDWGNYMLQMTQDPSTFVMKYHVYNLSASAIIPYDVPDVVVTPNNLVAPHSSNVRWLFNNVQVYANLFAAVCSDGTQIPVLAVHNTVDAKLAVMPFDFAHYPANPPTWTTGINRNWSVGLKRVYIIPNLAAKTNLLVFTTNGFTPAGLVEVATLTIDAGRVATVGPFVTYTVGAGPGTVVLDGQLLQTALTGALTIDRDFGTPRFGPSPLPSSYYWIPPDLSAYYGINFGNQGAPPLAPYMPRTAAMDSSGRIWSWDFRDGGVWHGPVGIPVIVDPVTHRYPVPLPIALPPWPVCLPYKKG